MKSSMSGSILANIAMMRGQARRHLPVLFLLGMDITPTSGQCMVDDYCVLRAPDRETADRAGEVLRSRGWKDVDVPWQLESVSLSLKPPNGSTPSRRAPGQEQGANPTPEREGDVPNPSSGNTPNPPGSRSTAGDQGEDGTKHPPNLVALAILRQVRERQKDRSQSDSSKTQDYLREARSGGMYGYGNTE